MRELAMSWAALRYHSPATLALAVGAAVVAGAVGLLLGMIAGSAASLSAVEFVFLLMLIMAPFGLIIAARVLGGLHKLLIVLMLVGLCLGIDLNLFFQTRIPAVSALNGLHISLLTLSLLAFYAWWILRHLTGLTRIPARALLAESKPIAAYTAFTVLSLVVAQSWLFAAFEINIVVQALLLYLYVLHVLQGRDDVLYFVTLLVLGLGMQGLLMLFLKASGGTLNLGIISAEADPFGRLSGTVGGSNQSADFLAMWMALTFGMMLTPAPFWLKLMGAGATLVALPAIFLTFSRGGWIALATATTLIGLVAWQRRWMPLWVPVVVGMLALAVLVPVWPYIIARLFGDDGGSAEARLPLMKMSLLVIRDHPIFGVGVNNYMFIIPKYLNSEFASTWVRVVHNKYLLLWAESGLFAMLTYLWFLFDTLYRGWRTVQRDHPYYSPLALALSAAIVGWMIHMNVALFHDSIQVICLTLAAGMIAAMNRLSRSEVGA
jgi:O-antigen ligase